MYHKITNWITKVYMFSSKAFLAIFNLLCSSIIIGVNIFVSFNHTLDLFSTVGWIGNIGLGATIGCELAFIQSSVNMMVCSLLGKRPSFPIIFVFTLGTGLVMWSNILSTLDSPTHWIPCVLLGLVPPLMMWGSKGVLADSMMLKQTKVETSNNQTNDHEQQTETNSEEIEQTDVQTNIERVYESSNESIVESKTESLDESYNQAIEQEKQTRETNTESIKRTEEDQTDSEPIEQSDNQTPNEHQTNEQTKKRTKYTPEQIEQIKQRLFDHLDKHGKYPSIRELARLSGCSSYIADKVIKAIKDNTEYPNKQTA